MATLKDYFPLALYSSSCSRYRTFCIPLLQAILEEKKKRPVHGQTSQGSPLFANFCFNYSWTLLYKGHSDFSYSIGANLQRIISGTKKNCLLGGEYSLDSRLHSLRHSVLGELSSCFMRMLSACSVYDFAGEPHPQNCKTVNRIATISR